MRTHWPLALTALAPAALALAGCQSAAEKHAAETGEILATDASTAEISALIKAARAKTTMKPGRWHLQMEIVSADLSGLPEATRAAQMAAIGKQARNNTACRDEKELKPIDIDQIEKAAGTCTFPRFVQVGGKVDAEIHCQQSGQPKTVMLAKGTTSPERFDVTLDQTTGTKGQPGYAAITLKAKGARLGECKPATKG